MPPTKRKKIYSEEDREQQANDKSEQAGDKAEVDVYIK